ncbi:MAG TPA: Crp/Fnr family transcriptional regulator [Candidatus Limnocylindria bacterium]|nr:Crp/Fnr family transcriptional regulator [Candidatus Limnocylindria bacterium]
MDLVSVARSLSDCLPVDELTDQQLSELLMHAQLRRFDREEVIYHRGDPSKHIHVMVEGAVKLVRDDAQGREVLLWVVERGGLFGQQGVFGTVRTATAIATMDTTTLQLVGEVVARVLERNPRIMFRAFQMIEARVEKLTQALEDVMLLDVPSRVAKYLLDSGEGEGRVASLTLTQDELAAAVGSTRVTVNKVLADFEHRGLIRVSRRHVDVISRDQLRREIHA